MTTPSLPKRGFVRTLFGAPENWRWERMEREIAREAANPFLGRDGFVVYAMGEENERNLLRLGLTVEMVDRLPVIYERKNFYRNRMVLWVEAMKAFDEVIFLDWDCYPVKPIPVDLWDRLAQKSEIQAPLYMYKTPRCPWRTGMDAHLVPNGGWVYLRRKDAPQRIFQHWDRFPDIDLDESVMASWMDQEYQWSGSVDYYRRFEPYCISLTRTRRIYGGSVIQDKEDIFQHIHTENKPPGV